MQLGGQQQRLTHTGAHSRAISSVCWAPGKLSKSRTANEEGCRAAGCFSWRQRRRSGGGSIAKLTRRPASPNACPGLVVAVRLCCQGPETADWSLESERAPSCPLDRSAAAASLHLEVCGLEESRGCKDGWAWAEDSPALLTTPLEAAAAVASPPRAGLAHL